jgi:hypothetical protein
MKAYVSWRVHGVVAEGRFWKVAEGLWKMGQIASTLGEKFKEFIELRVEICSLPCNPLL